MKQTNDLIHELSQGHKKIKRDLSPIVKTFLTLYSFMASLFLGLNLINPFVFKSKSHFHTLELISLFLLVHSLVFLGFKATIPGENKIKAFIVTLTSFFFTAIVFLNRLTEQNLYSVVRVNCEFEAIVTSFFTTLMVHFLLRKNEYAKHNQLSTLLIFGFPIIITFFMHGVCSINLIHMLSCHVLAPLMIPIFYVLFLKNRSFFLEDSK